jgi:hypothetical protein
MMIWIYKDMAFTVLDGNKINNFVCLAFISLHRSIFSII